MCGFGLSSLFALITLRLPSPWNDREIRNTRRQARRHRPLDRLWWLLPISWRHLFWHAQLYMPVFFPFPPHRFVEKKNIYSCYYSQGPRGGLRYVKSCNVYTHAGAIQQLYVQQQQQKKERNFFSKPALSYFPSKPSKWIETLFINEWVSLFVPRVKNTNFQLYDFFFLFLSIKFRCSIYFFPFIFFFFLME